MMGVVQFYWPTSRTPEARNARRLPGRRTDATQCRQRAPQSLMPPGHLAYAANAITGQRLRHARREEARAKETQLAIRPRKLPYQKRADRNANRRSRCILTENAR